MKKIVLSMLAVALLLSCAATLFSCEGDDSTTLNIYNWGEYISDGSEGSLDVNAEFTARTGIKVNYTTFSSNEDMYAKLKSGAVSYDIIIPSDYMIERMIKEGMLEKLNFDNIPNYQYIDEKYKSLPHDPEDAYSVPYNVGLMGVIYNTEVVAEGDTGSWSLLWNEKYSGKILQYNNPRDAFATAQFKNGIDVNSLSEAEWRTALDELVKQKPIVQSYVMDEIYNKMESGESAVSSYYAGDFLTMYSNNDKLAFYYPSEGTNIFMDSVCIPVGCRNKEAAEKYIDFLLDKEIAMANAEYICYASPNTQVVNDPEYIAAMNEIHENAIGILYDIDEEYLDKCIYYRNLPDENLMLINSLWEELKIDSSLGAGIYIISALIIAAIIGGIVFIVVRKKKRSAY